MDTSKFNMRVHMNDADVNLTVTALSESEVDAQTFTCE